MHVARALLFASSTAVLGSLAGCGGDDPPPPAPTAYEDLYVDDENTDFTSSLDATQVDWDSAVFTIVDEPLNGDIVAFDDYTGDFTYSPDTNFVGSDDFTWYVSDRYGSSALVYADIDVEDPTSAIRAYAQ